MDKKYARLGINADGLLVKINGYLVADGNYPPEDTVLISDEQEAKLNNGYYVVNADTMELAAIPPHVTTLAEAQAAKRIELKAARDNEEVENITYNGNVFDYDEKARERLKTARQLLEDSMQGSITWTTADNTDVSLTVADFKGINTAVAVRSNELHVKYRTLMEQVASCETVEAVEAIKW